jgi:hypothetical protein
MKILYFFFLITNSIFATDNSKLIDNKNKISDYMISTFKSVEIDIEQNTSINNRVLLSANGKLKIKEKKFLYSYKTQNPKTDISILKNDSGFKLIDNINKTITYLSDSENEFTNILINPSKESLIEKIKDIEVGQNLMIAYVSSENGIIKFSFSFKNNQIEVIKKIEVISKSEDSVTNLAIEFKNIIFRDIADDEFTLKDPRIFDE